MSMDDGIITFTSNNGSYVEGDLLTQLGVEMLTETITTTTTVGTKVTGNSITFTTTMLATMTSYVHDFVSSGNFHFDIYDKDGNLLTTYAWIEMSGTGAE